MPNKSLYKSHLILSTSDETMMVIRNYIPYSFMVIQ